jgi:hypothetical protein
MSVLAYTGSLLRRRQREIYPQLIERFCGSLPTAEWVQMLPGGRSGMMIPRLWAELAMPLVAGPRGATCKPKLGPCR